MRKNVRLKFSSWIGAKLWTPWSRTTRSSGKHTRWIFPYSATVWCSSTRRWVLFLLLFCESLYKCSVRRETRTIFQPVVAKQYPSSMHWFGSTPSRNSIPLAYRSSFSWIAGILFLTFMPSTSRFDGIYSYRSTFQKPQQHQFGSYHIVCAVAVVVTNRGPCWSFSSAISFRKTNTKIENICQTCVAMLLPSMR